MGKETCTLVIFLLITKNIMAIVSGISHEFLLFSNITGVVCPNEYILFEVETSSITLCMMLCATDGSCKGIDYNEGTSICHGYQGLEGANCIYEPLTFTYTPGTVMYAKDKGLLISGMEPISYVDLSSSTNWWTGGLGASSYYSRYCFFVQTSNGNAAWTSAYSDTNQWIQARLTRLAIVVGIYLLPRTGVQCVTSYELEYSTAADCSGFQYYTDSNGNAMVFAGNTDVYTPTRTILPDLVNAQCVRIRPMSWYSHISLRFDVIGYFP